MNIKLRPWTEADLDTLVKYADNPTVSRLLNDGFPYPYTEQDGRDFIAWTSADNPRKILAIEVDGEAVGSIGVFPQDNVHRLNAEAGYWLAEQFWGQGIMPEAVRLICEYGFANFDIDRIFARPFGVNARSQRVLEKAGFTLEARFEKTVIKNGVLMDELYYAIRRPENTK